MAKLSKKDMEELRGFCSLGCDYSGTKEIIYARADEVLKELGSELGFECMCVTDNDGFSVELEDFIRTFYGKVVENILNVVETQGR